MSLIPEPKDNPTGLHQRYRVTKADGSPTDPNAVYFVLRLDGHGDDPLHIAACRAAAAVYSHFVQMATDKRLAQVGTELATLIRFLDRMDKAGKTA